MNTEKSSEAVRRARRELHTKVRNDWDDVLVRALPGQNPAAPASGAGDPGPNGAVAGEAESPALSEEERYPFRRKQTRQIKTVHADPASTIKDEAVDWRERTYASSDPSSDEESWFDVPKLFARAQRKGSAADDDSEADPDAYDPTLTFEERKKQDRKNRRRKRLEDEMSMNPGLRYWEQRRDVWCLAQSVPSSSRAQWQKANTEPLEVATSSSASTSTSDSRDSSLSSPSSPTHDNEQPQDSKDPLPTQPPALPKLKSQQSTTQLLPVAPPLLPPNDPTRQTITPTTYPSIYSKLVTQSLAPSVPINLSHVVPALVQGWKESGEWPPRPAEATTTAAETSAAVSRVAKTQQQQQPRSSMMRKLRIVDERKGKGRLLLGQAVVRRDACGGDNDADENASPGDAAQAEAQEKTSGATAAAEEKEGSGTSTPDSSSPLKVRMSAMRGWARR